MQPDKDNLQRKEEKTDLGFIMFIIILVIIIGIITVALSKPQYSYAISYIFSVAVAGISGCIITLSFLNAFWKTVKALNKISNTLEEIKNQNSENPLNKKLEYQPILVQPIQQPTTKPETMQINCPKCQKTLNILKTYKGTFNCPYCKQKLQIE